LRERGGEERKLDPVLTRRQRGRADPQPLVWGAHRREGEGGKRKKPPVPRRLHHWEERDGGTPSDAWGLEKPSRHEEKKRVRRNPRARL